MTNVIYLPKRDPTPSDMRIIRFAEASEHHARAKLMAELGAAIVLLKAISLEAQNSPGRGPCVVQAGCSLSEQSRPGEP